MGTGERGETEQGMGEWNWGRGEASWEGVRVGGTGERLRQGKGEKRRERDGMRQVEVGDGGRAGLVARG